jgi:hypothetical protein
LTNHDNAQTRRKISGWELFDLITVLEAAIARSALTGRSTSEAIMNSLIYLVGLVVVVMLILSFFGLR